LVDIIAIRGPESGDGFTIAFVESFDKGLGGTRESCPLLRLVFGSLYH
jgi:hypothetical protein